MIIVIVGVVVFVLVWVLLFGLVVIGFVIGVIFFGVVGYIGMMVFVCVNVCMV